MKFPPALLLYLWAGLVLGISFLETPLKFKAPGITTLLGVGIGKLVFNALNKIEIILFVALLLLLGVKRILESPNVYFISVLFFCLLVQSAYLLPILNERVSALMEHGIAKPNSFYHLSYIILEVVKCATLLWGGWHFHKIISQ